jgi:hypothetical protein
MPSEKLIPCCTPSAPVRLFETQPPLVPDGVTVERYTTARDTVFEKHTDANGVTHWFLVQKVS